MRNSFIKFIAIICCFMSLTASSQYRYQAKIPAVSSSDFYKVELPPAVVGKCQPNFADIRIRDAQGKENPYIIKTSEAEFVERNFKEFSIYNKHKGADNQTHVIIANPTKEKLDNLLLLIKNTQAQRTVTLSGGEDTATWYVIKENLLLENYFSNSSDGSFIQSITFPVVDYPFLKITILGKDVLPVNIIKAGIYTEKFQQGNFITLPQPLVTTVDSSDKNTYIHLHFNQPYQVDQLHLQVSGAKFYKRRILLYPGTTTQPPPLEFLLASNAAPSYSVGFRASDMLIVIENGDNPPLHIDGVIAQQLNKYLLSFLEKEKTYKLTFGDSLAAAPVYDLSFFADSIPANIVAITPATIEQVVSTPKQEKKESRSIALWIVIIAVLCLLLFVSIKMLSDADKRKPDEANS